MGGVHRVSTVGIPVSDRTTFWTRGANEVGSIGAINVSPLSNVFEAEAQTRKMGPLLVFGLKVTPHKVIQCCKRDEGVLKLRYQRSGESVIEQYGGRRVLRSGEWTVIDGSLPHCMINTEETSQISLHIPRGVLSERDFRLASSIGRTVPMSGSVGKLLFDCLRFSLEELEETSEPTEFDLGTSMLEMFRAAVNQVASERMVASSRETIEQRVREYIRRNLNDPSLSVASIANAIGCSGRYIHKIFEGQESVTRIIWSQRLERCRLELTSAGRRRRTLTELAYQYGFSSSAHFSRAFKERYGVAPSAFRKQAAGSPGDEVRIN